MSIYLILYILVILWLIHILFIFYKKYFKQLFWKYLFIWVLSYIIWLILYVISFSYAFWENILIILSRFMYGLSFLATYSIIFFVILFNNNYSKKIIKIINYIYFFIFLWIFLLTISSNIFIKSMIYDNINNIYYEDFWKWFILYKIFYLFNPLLFIFCSYVKTKQLHSIKKFRFKYLSIWYWIFIFLYVFFLALLPILWIWVLQKEQILFFIPFLISVWYSVYKYYFSDIKIFLWKIIVFIFSLFSSIFIVTFLKFFYLRVDLRLVKFWWISSNLWIFDLILSIILFSILFDFFGKHFLWNNKINKLNINLLKLKKNIPFIFNLNDLNIFLRLSFDKLFKIKYVNIKLFDDNENNSELYKFFDKNFNWEIFINDIVFIEENKHKFNKEILREEINHNIYLVFPIINNKNDLIWIFEIANKPFRDQFYSEEIKELKSFVDFISWHLKYMEIYSKINDLNLNLDKKIDEKTIEYNTLLSKQREFISMSSHEIKTPITSAIFQIDCLIDDFKEWKTSSDFIKNELNILNEQLMKIWDLVNKIFKVQEYDIKEIKLFIEKINIKNLLLNEIERFKKVNKNTIINIFIDENISYVEIDKVQFTQVIDNLLNNAIKFSNKKNPVITLSCKKNKENITIFIEDNWKWFTDIDKEIIFNKYVTWQSSSIWIWLWLYLCKKIISMHNWNIIAENSLSLWWAKFIIEIPLKYK